MSELSQLILRLVWTYLSVFFIGYLIAKKASLKEIIDTNKKYISSLDDHVDTLHKWQETINESFEKNFKIMDLEQKVAKYVPITEINKSEILKLAKQGLTHEKIAKKFWLEKSTISKAIKKWEKESCVKS